MISRASCVIGGAIIVAALLAGCSSGPAATSPVVSATPSPRPSTLGAGFWDPRDPPAPEGTIAPAPGSWAEADPPAGYTVVLLTSADEDAQSLVLEKAVRSWADAENVRLDAVVAESPDDRIPATYRAIDRAPDLIIGVGNAMVDPLAAVTPSHLARQFLIVGAEIAEPTSNVTAADWTGAGFRGEGLGTPTEYDPASFTSARADRAIRAGIAAVLNDLTGIVVWVS